MQIAIVLCLVAAASARPSYIAVPADQIAFVDLSKVHLRVPRQALAPPPPPGYDEDYLPIPVQGLHHYQQIPIQQYQQQPLNLIPIGAQNQALRQPQGPQDVAGPPDLGDSPQPTERAPDFGEYVDFGAHTGDNGAFGWYADYPVNNGHTQDSIGFR